MWLFRYKAARSDGQVIEGTLEAASPDDVARLLQTQGSMPLHIAAATAQSAPPRAASRERPKAKAGHATLMTAELLDTLVDHAAGNCRLLMTLGGELLAYGMAEEIAQLDEKAFLEVFQPGRSRPATKKKARA